MISVPREDSVTLTPTAPSLTDIPFGARGPLSSALLDRFAGDVTPLPAAPAGGDVLADDDVQLTLFLLYAAAYGSLPGIPAEMEWDLELLALRADLEARFEAELRARIPVPELPAATRDAVASALFALTSADAGPSLSRHLAKKATLDQAREFLILRSVYTLREADPHSWAIPRLNGRAKAALVEIQADEYGGGRADRVHAEIFAKAMRGAGLDATYGRYVDDVPVPVLTSLNMMSMFGLNRRLVGAIVGHLAAFEMTSSIPNRLYAEGLRRLGFDDEVTDYFDEHVEADAVHEQIAGRDLAGSLAEDRPELLADILWGAAACLEIDGAVGGHALARWSEGGSALRSHDDA